MDRLSKAQRQKVMRAVKSTGSRIERKLALALWHKGYRYRKNDHSVFGAPDLVFKSLKIAIFCDSEFWHGKNWQDQKNRPQSNAAFWQAKIKRNRERDRLVTLTLQQQGWEVLRFWGNEINKNLSACVHRIEAALLSRQASCAFSMANKRGAAFIRDHKSTVTHYLHNHDQSVYKSALLPQLNYHILPSSLNRATPARVAENLLDYIVFDAKRDCPFPAPKKPKFSFIDLFAGIGSCRIALQNLGGKCIFSGEPDHDAGIIYEANFGERPFTETDEGVIAKYIPDRCDILCADLSAAAHATRNKRNNSGPEHIEPVRLVQTIIRMKCPLAFLLACHACSTLSDHKHRLSVIRQILCRDLNYSVPETYHTTAQNCDAPQQRQYGFIVGFRDDINAASFRYPVAKRQDSERMAANNPQHTDKNVTARALARIRGFPDAFQLVIPEAQARNKLSRAVSVPIIQQMATRLVKLMMRHKKEAGMTEK